MGLNESPVRLSFFLETAQLDSYHVILLFSNHEAATEATKFLKYYIENVYI